MEVTWQDLAESHLLLRTPTVRGGQGATDAAVASKGLRPIRKSKVIILNCSVEMGESEGDFSLPPPITRKTTAVESGIESKVERVFHSNRKRPRNISPSSVDQGDPSSTKRRLASTTIDVNSSSAAAIKFDASLYEPLPFDPGAAAAAAAAAMVAVAAVREAAAEAALAML